MLAGSNSPVWLVPRSRATPPRLSATAQTHPLSKPASPAQATAELFFFSLIFYALYVALQAIGGHLRMQSPLAKGLWIGLQNFVAFHGTSALAKRFGFDLVCPKAFSCAVLPCLHGYLWPGTASAPGSCAVGVEALAFQPEAGSGGVTTRRVAVKLAHCIPC